MIIPLFIALSIVALIIIIVSWIVHISMTSDSSNKSGWANHSTFKKWFEGYEWESSDNFKGSLWNRKMDCEYHAGIIKFEGTGMKINNPYSYILVTIYVRRYIKRIKSDNRVDFKRKYIGNKPEKKGYNVHLPNGDTVYVSLEEIYGRKLE